MTKPKPKQITSVYPDGEWALTQELDSRSPLLCLTHDGVFKGYICMSGIIKHVVDKED